MEWPGVWAGLVRSFLEKSIVRAVPVVTCGSVVEVRPPPLSFPCPDCPRAFSSVRGLHSHQLSVHCGDTAMNRDRASNFIVGTICPVCKADFICRPRLLLHVKHGAARCRFNPASLFWQGLRLTSVEIESAQCKDRSRAAACRQAGTTVSQGPLHKRADRP